MIIGTSALIAILREDPEAQAIAQATDRRMSAANWLEAAVVIDGSRDPIASRRFDELVNTARIVVEPVTEQRAQLARAA